MQLSLNACGNDARPTRRKSEVPTRADPYTTFCTSLRELVPVYDNASTSRPALCFAFIQAFGKIITQGVEHAVSQHVSCHFLQTTRRNWMLRFTYSRPSCSTQSVHPTLFRNACCLHPLSATNTPHHGLRGCGVSTTRLRPDQYQQFPHLFLFRVYTIYAGGRHLSHPTTTMPTYLCRLTMPTYL